jgi:dipeptide/tripeptide permease
VGLNTADLHSNIEGDGDNVFYTDWIGLGPDHVDVSFYMPVDSELTMCGFLSIEELCDECVGGEYQEKHGLEPVPSFIKCVWLMNVLNHSFTNTALASMVKGTF